MDVDMKNKDDNEEKGIIVPVSSSRDRDRERDRDRDRDYDRDKDRDRDHDRERRDRDKDRDRDHVRRESGAFPLCFISLMSEVFLFRKVAPREVGVTTGNPKVDATELRWVPTTCTLPHLISSTAS
jgi:hypothetical protein